MFQKVRFRLTCFFAAITICILCLFTGLYLYLSQKALEENYALSFQRDMVSLSASLEQQTVITFQYLNTLEQNKHYFIYLWDQETPFHFNDSKQHSSTRQLADAALAMEPEQLQLSQDTGGRLLFFRLKDEKGLIYDVCRASLTSGQPSAAQNLAAKTQNRILTLLVIYPRTELEAQLFIQRLWFILLSFSGCILLTFFAWIFTGRLLLPIQESQQQQNQFMADASHELRTPLAVILSCISGHPPHYEETIRRECIRMGHLIEDMLLLTGLENRRLPLSLKELEPDTLLLDAYECMEPLALEKGLHLRIELAEYPLPRLQADYDKLKQLLMILLQNAVSYTPKGGTILLTGKNAGNRLSFQVIDNGPGIPDGDKSHIFERFYRVEASRNDKGHFGLGLCIAKEIAQTHHGMLQVSDTPGGGTTFTCTLPLKAPAAAP